MTENGYNRVCDEFAQKWVQCTNPTLVLTAATFPCGHLPSSVESTYRTLLELTRDGVLRCTLEEGRILAANQGLVELLDLDCPPDALKGRRLQDLLILGGPPIPIHGALREQGILHDFEYQFRTLTGEDRWVLCDALVVPDEQTKEPVIVAVLRDVTQSKQAQVALRRERDFISAILELVGALVVVMDTEGRIETFNRVCEETTGYTFAEVRGRTFWDLFLIPEERNSVMEVFGRLRAGDFPSTHENYWVARDGTPHLIAWSNSVLVDEHGSIQHIIGTGIDITEARQAQNALVQARDELEQRVELRTAELAAANDSLREEIATRERAERRIMRQAEDLTRSNQELEQFAYVASHDLQEPLRKIRAFSDRLEACCGNHLGDEARDYLTRIESAAARMQTLINDLLSYSRVTTQGRPFVPVALDELVQEVLTDLEVAIELADATVHVAPLATLEADPLQMRQLLQNLISNALKFRRPDTPLSVTLAGEEVEPAVVGGCRRYRLTVSDNGIGFDNRHAERIFSVFQRLHTREEYEGTGMGLAICRKIVERHGGTITAHGTPGAGATFTVTLPMKQ